jgi:hypothetical protein
MKPHAAKDIAMKKIRDYIIKQAQQYIKSYAAEKK